MNIKILLCDDEPDIRRIAEIALRGSSRGSTEIFQAGSGREALELARRHAPDVVVLDVMMPELDGLAALAALKADPATRAVPVVLMTARASRAEQARYLGLGAAAVVVKPFDPSQLTGTIARVLEARPAAPDPARRLAAELAALRDDFIARMPAQLAQLAAVVAAAATATDEAGARKLAATAAAEAHRLRGTAGSLGLGAFAASMSRLEDALGEPSAALDRAASEAALAAARDELLEVSCRR
jgi:CheY-like chemotaxis protein